jgi:hypothetical protein
MPAFTEVRSFLPIDVPLLHRLHAYGVTLESATRLVRGLNVLEGAMLGAVPLADLGTPTFVLKHHHEMAYVGQYRHKWLDPHAHIVFIAPELDGDEGFSAWLHLISAMVASAAKRGAMTLNAEVEEGSLACEVLHRAGFATYARQEIWRRSPAPITGGDPSLWRASHDADALGITALYASIVPRLVMQADMPPDVKHGGLVYECNGKIAAYLAIQEGKHGIYLQPYLHPEVCASRADDLIAGAVAALSRADRLPIYVCVRRYQSWLGHALDMQRFEVWMNEAVMVKHTTARIEHPAFRAAYAFERGGVVAYPGHRVGTHLKRCDSSYRESTKFDRISYHRRSGKAESRSPSLPGGRA